jgi:hypothetical protein
MHDCHAKSAARIAPAMKYGRRLVPAVIGRPLGRKSEIIGGGLK